MTPLTQVTDMPKTPAEAARSQQVARLRAGELQDIFTSPVSAKCEELRAQLGDLDKEADDLRAHIAGLEQELHLERSNKVRSSTSRGEDAEGVGSDGPGGFMAPSNKTRTPTQGGSPSRRYGSVSDGAQASPKQGRNLHTDRFGIGSAMAEDFGIDEKPSPEMVRMTFNADNDQEEASALSPLLFQRRAEARYREARQCHESIVAHMREELTTLERRITKQQLWLKHIDEQVFKAEVAKMQYQVRLSTAQRRTQSLGQDLSKAYKHMSELLRQRMAVEDVAAENDAIDMYIDVVRAADVENSDNFIENKAEVAALLGVCNQFRESQGRLEGLLEQVREKQTISMKVIEKAEALNSLNDQLHKMWIMVPANLKQRVFRRKVASSKGKQAPGEDLRALQPATLIKEIETIVGKILEEQRRHLALLGELASRSLDDLHLTIGAGASAPGHAQEAAF